MDSVVRKTLRGPVRKLTSCVSGEREKEVMFDHRQRRARGGARGAGGAGGGAGGAGGGGREGAGGGGGGVRSARRRPCRGAPPQAAPCPRESAAPRSHQPGLDPERQPREGLNAKKNAERAALRAHYRRKYQLTRSAKDTDHLRPFGGKIALPRELAKIVHSDSKSKDDGFNLLKAFQGLSFSTGPVQGARRSHTPTPQTANGATCQVM
ncbi:complexin-3-like isoform X2 [Gadus macrocephalus]|uniref:complexin-3-like isoform X2 n=1 Tax=Gadus macrocephalus TaxID=80720 RepID=UPI0028CB4B41|nr:complexin-3-like isoform X2 [Gadus macrocephalus]